MNEADRIRLDAEWLAVNAVRELINIATEGDSRKASYNQALKLGAEICPSLLGEDVSLIRQNRESEEARYYRQLASARQGKGENVDALQLLNSDMSELETFVAAARNQQDVDRLRRRLAVLARAKTELSPEPHSEHELIFRDAYNVDRDLPVIRTGKSHRDFQISDEEVLRVRVLHPDKAEQISGADIIYEKHSENGTITMAAIQYKIWEGRRLYLGDQRMQAQLSRMRGFFCDREMCRASQLDHTFRFPFCAAFLRPTDRLQCADQELRSTGEHVPICHIDSIASSGPMGGSYLDYDAIRGLSLSHIVFEELFTSGKLGSRTISHEELESLYAGMAGLEGDRLIIQAQEFSAR